MILIVGNTKGGGGKTTIAFNCAVTLANAGRDVMLVDADTQATAMNNAVLRKEKLGEVGFTAVALYGEAVLIQVPQLAQKYDDVIIDVGGRDNPSFRSALLIPKATLLVPVKPRSYDLWGADDTVDLVSEARARGNTTLRVVAVINEADHLQDTENAAAIAQLKDKKELEIAPIRLVRRKAYPDAAAQGRGVTEFKDPKAAQELEALLGFIHPHYNHQGMLKHATR